MSRYNGFFNYPQPTKEKGQKSIDIDDLFLYRLTPPWSRPSTLPAQVWRNWVMNQPVAMVSRESLVATIISLDWKITPRNSNYKEELEPTIRYYTRLFTRGGDYGSLQLDYSGLLEWIVGDLLDTPFGGAAELGRRGNDPSGRVVWIRPLDSGTLYPTLNDNYPTVQYYQQYDAVSFPKGFIARSYMSPHSNIWREGWGMAPPEKVYFALEMLNRGDKYYANLLTDVPTAGILDLGDMEKSAAEEWITAFKTFVADTSQSFRIPVLYEHNNKVEFLPFGKVPNDLMFDRITLKYAALVASAYGLSLSDIGLQTTSASGETLAGSIRQERRTRRTGVARLKAKVKSFFDQILPESLEFNLIDYDDELNVAMGRARLATGQAFAAWRQMGLFSPQELRSQVIQDGLVSISMPDEIPPEAEPDEVVKPNAEPELVGNPKPVSAGGEGKSLVDTVSFKPKRNFDKIVKSIVDSCGTRIQESLQGISEDELGVYKSLVGESIFSEDDTLELNATLADVLKGKSLGVLDFDVNGLLEDESISPLDIAEFKQEVSTTLSDYIGKTALFLLNDEVALQIGLGEEINYESITSKVVDRLHRSLNEFVKIHVNVELENFLKKF